MCIDVTTTCDTHTHARTHHTPHTHLQLVPVITIGRCRLEDKDSTDTNLGEAKAIGSLDDWMKSILTALCGQG